MNKSKILLFLLKLFVIISLFSGIITYASFSKDNEYIKLWKEMYIIILYIISCLITLPKVNMKALKITILLIFFVIFYFSYSRELLPSYLIFYQFKMDCLILIMFAVGFLIFSICINEDLKKYMLRLTKIILICAVINALFIIYQHFFTNVFLNIIDLNYGDWGASNGVKVITSGGQIRAIGFLSGFVQSGEFMLFNIILLIENKKYIKLNNIFFIISLSILTVALFFTTLKNAILGLIIYFIIKFFESIFRRKSYKEWFIIIFSIIVFIVQAITTNGLFVYNIINKISPIIAHNSIYLRVIQHNYVFDSLENIHQFFFGLGYGLNGTYGIDKSLYGISAIALDSTYIYLLSNIGFIGVTLYVIFLFYILIKLYNNSRTHCFGIQYFIIYLLDVEFFYNNIFASFPVNLITVIYICYSLIAIKRRINISIDECRPKKLRIIWK